jgi:MFS family permease
MTAVRALWILLVLAWGVAWAIVTVISRQGPRYWDAVTALDFAAVWSYSVALTLSAGVVWLTGWLARGRRLAAPIAVLVGAGLLLTAGANAVEDGFGVKSFGTLYVIGAVIGFYGSVLLAASYAVARAPLLALVAVATGIGAMLIASVGGFIALAVSLWFAERLVRRPDGLRPRSRTAIQDAPSSVATP